MAGPTGTTGPQGDVGPSGAADLSLNQFTGDGSTTTFTLSNASLENNTFVYFSGAYQSKADYTVSSADPAVVTFTSAPANSTAIEIMVASVAVTPIGTPSDNTVTSAKLADDAVTSDKIADSSITPEKIDSAPISVGITTVVTSTSMTATVNTHVFVDTATQTITLPLSPTIGQRVLVTVGNFEDTVIGRNGSNIMSSGTDMTLDKAYLSIQFIFTDATQGWVMA